MNALADIPAACAAGAALLDKKAPGWRDRARAAFAAGRVRMSGLTDCLVCHATGCSTWSESLKFLGVSWATGPGRCLGFDAGGDDEEEIQKCYAALDAAWRTLLETP